MAAATRAQQMLAGNPGTWDKAADRKIPLAAGTMSAVRLIEHVSSEKSQALTDLSRNSSRRSEWKQMR
jgi:hypothetical protein